MAITFRKNSSRETLYALAVENGVKVTEDADRATIIAALNAHNATESAQASDGTNTPPDNEQPAQGAQDGAGDVQASDGTNTPPDDEQPAQGAQDGADTEDKDEYNMFVYVGPSLPNGQLKENAVFRGTFKDVSGYLADALEKYPQAVKLIVPLHKLGEYSAKAKKSGNIINKYYGDIVSTMSNHKEV